MDRLDAARPFEEQRGKEVHRIHVDPTRFEGTGEEEQQEEEQHRRIAPALKAPSRKQRTATTHNSGFRM